MGTQAQPTTVPTQVQPAPLPTQEPVALPAQAEPATLHDFTLGLLADPAALASFQDDPAGALSAAGLDGITAGDVYEILPLVLDSASVVKVDAVDDVLVHGGGLSGADHLKLVTDNLLSIAPITDVAPGGIAAVVNDFSDLGDVSSTLDACTDVTTNVVGNSVVTEVTDNTVKVTDLVDVDSKIDVVDDVVAKTAVLNDNDLLNGNDVLTGDLDSTIKHVVSDNVVQDVAQVGDVTVGQVVGDINVGDILDGGAGNGNDFDIHF